MREWLKTLRQESGISQSKAATELGIAQSYYSLIENGSRQQRLSLVLAQKIAALFNVTIEYVLQNESEVAKITRR